MKSSFRLFVVIELLLLIFGIYQIVYNPALLILLIFGIFNIYHVLAKKKRRNNFNNFQLVLGGFSIFMSLVSSVAFWMMLVFGILYIGLKGIEISGTDLTKQSFWRRKQMIMVDVEEAGTYSASRQQQQWFGNQRIGNEVYEWDDININLIAGDTIVDLGNTLLPKDDSVVIIRKGFGRTRILVPAGISIQLQHSTLYGTVSFDEETTLLKNESIRLYTTDYDENPRRLKLLTNSLVGDVEVIRV
ncbi:lia operon protein LiaF [Enterococcus sp. PF1-24]|uniref:cell wall-active antibiotics response protein LiaF n=1 Tax=unclassified Enterococcus TaxID=2608891 RepID=UPI00247319BE|nr:MULTISPECIES: cell wall-active antibiotics response protein LiaF [unclassified Enterococcus]MDH6363607.1 lia operon protein LiaF [Enterococcus sp. PFB1-1]MDH6400842.1 lia operon protein LiaF [Enterococcus sp. PF1-24]